jgi:hypothetical protein
VTPSIPFCASCTMPPAFSPSGTATGLLCAMVPPPRFSSRLRSPSCPASCRTPYQLRGPCPPPLLSPHTRCKLHRPCSFHLLALMALQDLLPPCSFHKPGISPGHPSLCTATPHDLFHRTGHLLHRPSASLAPLRCPYRQSSLAVCQIPGEHLLRRDIGFWSRKRDEHGPYSLPITTTCSF